MIEFADWIRNVRFAPKPWLVLGKGPTFARRGEFDLTGFHRFALNHVVRELSVQIAHMIDADVAEARRDDPRLLVVVAGDVALQLPRLAAREQRDAVVRPLPVARCAVAGGLDLGNGKAVVGELGFLQHDRVDRVRSQPVEQLRQPYRERVDVPGGEFQWRPDASSPPGFAEPFSVAPAPFTAEAALVVTTGAEAGTVNDSTAPKPVPTTFCAMAQK